MSTADESPASGRRSPASSNTSERAYHHGNLRHALIEEAIELARTRGQDAIVLREVARRVGVSPTSAYRHFTDRADLIHAVKLHALVELAEAFDRELDAIPASDGRDAESVALDRLRVVGRAYVSYALDQPGMFRVAMDRRDEDRPTFARPWEHDAYVRLSTVLDDLVATGYLASSRRQHAEIAFWSAIHGLAMLFLSGPLASMAPDQRDAICERTLDMAIHGLQ